MEERSTMRRIHYVQPGSFVLTSAPSRNGPDPDAYFPAPGVTDEDAQIRERMLEQIRQLLDTCNQDFDLLLPHFLDGTSQRDLSSEAGVNVGTICRRVHAQRARLIADGLAREAVTKLTHCDSCAFLLPQVRPIEAKRATESEVKCVVRLRCPRSTDTIAAKLVSNGNGRSKGSADSRQALLGGIAVASRCQDADDIVIELYALPRTQPQQRPR
jgi:hypothetical protein